MIYQNRFSIKGGCNLSFAGLKTAILRITKNIKTDQEKFDLGCFISKNS